MARVTIYLVKGCQLPISRAGKVPLADSTLPAGVYQALTRLRICALSF